MNNLFIPLIAAAEAAVPASTNAPLIKPVSGLSNRFVNADKNLAVKT